MSLENANVSVSLYLEELVANEKPSECLMQLEGFCSIYQSNVDIRNNPEYYNKERPRRDSNSRPTP